MRALYCCARRIVLDVDSRLSCLLSTRMSALLLDSCVLCLRTNKQNRFLQSLNNTQYRPDPGKTETNEGKIFQQAHLNISLEIILSIWIFISLNAIYLYPGNRVVDLSLNKDPLKVSEQNEKFRFRILKTVNLVNLLASGLSKLKFWFSDQT